MAGPSPPSSSAKPRTSQSRDGVCYILNCNPRLGTELPGVANSQCLVSQRKLLPTRLLGTGVGTGKAEIVRSTPSV